MMLSFCTLLYKRKTKVTNFSYKFAILIFKTNFIVQAKKLIKKQQKDFSFVLAMSPQSAPENVGFDVPDPYGDSVSASAPTTPLGAAGIVIITNGVDFDSF